MFCVLDAFNLRLWRTCLSTSLHITDCLGFELAPVVMETVYHILGVYEVGRIKGEKPTPFHITRLLVLRSVFVVTGINISTDI